VSGEYGLAVVAVLLMIGWYLSYTAARLDRLHEKVQARRATLDVQLVRRAAAAVELGQQLDPAAGLILIDAATSALSAGEDPDPQADPLAVPTYLEDVENELSRSLTHVLGDPAEVAELRGRPYGEAALQVLVQATERVQLARRFHNDAVAQAQRVRRKRVVRWARLAGFAPWPQMIEIDDQLPAALSR
jgi:hypothetical protein